MASSKSNTVSKPSTAGTSNAKASKKTEIVKKEAVTESAADVINRLHVTAEGETIRGVSVVITAWAEVGKALIDQKAKTPHGQWLTWMKNNLNFSDRQARRYMSAHENRALLLASGATNMDKSLLMISAPEKVIEDEGEIVVDLEAEDRVNQINKLEKELEGAKQLIEELQNDDPDSEYEQLYSETLAELNALKQQGAETPEEAESEINKLKKMRDKLRQDVTGLDGLSKMVVRTREFFAKEVALIPTLRLSPSVVKHTKKDVESMIELMENWVTAMKEKFDV